MSRETEDDKRRFGKENGSTRQIREKEKEKEEISRGRMEKTLK